MEICRSIESVRGCVARQRAAGRRVGLVPTMGALHRGHVALIDAARAAGGSVVVSVFVNPTQFAPGEDFQRYPRPEAEDLRQCAAANADAVFLPPVEAMYPAGACTTVSVAGLADHLCGPHRPGHFAGVATVVSKLFNIVQPDAAYFGQKDFQQLAIIRRVAADLNFPLEVVGCETVREPDGLAMSSRNAYLSPADRAQAASVYAALRRMADAARAGQDRAGIEHVGRQTLLAAGPCVVDYVSLVDAATLQPTESTRAPRLAAIAVRIGGTRLIDNLVIEAAAKEA